MEKTEKRKKRLAIVASKGTLDMAYPPFILATAAAAMGWEVAIFFTFYGLNIVNKKKSKKLKVASLANPAAPLPVPNILGVLPGATAAATAMLKSMMKKQNLPSLPEFIQMAKDMGVRLLGCSTTMGVMAVPEENLMEGVECAGAASFLEYASEADVTLFV